MATFNELMQNYVNLPYSQLLSIARNSLLKITPVFNKIADDGNGAKYVLPIICCSLAVDGKFTKLEYKFITDLIGDVDYDTVLAVVQQNYSENAQQYADNVLDACGDDLKLELLTLCLCLTAVDETISREEAAFIKRLID